MVVLWLRACMPVQSVGFRDQGFGAGVLCFFVFLCLFILGLGRDSMVISDTLAQSRLLLLWLLLLIRNRCFG